MKTRKLISVLFSVLLLTAITFAQRPDRARGPDRMAEMLELTEEQQAKMEDMRLEMKREMTSLHPEMEKLKAELKLEMTSDNYDEAKIQSIVDQMTSLRKEMQIKRLNHQRTVRNLLTPEQRKKFDMHVLSERGPRRGGHRGFHGGKHQGFRRGAPPPHGD